MRSALIISSLALSVTIVFLFAAFAMGAGKTVLDSFAKSSSANTIVVFRKTGVGLGGFDFGKTGMGDLELAEIQKIEGVKKATPLILLKFPNTIHLTFGFRVTFDMIFFGMDASRLPVFDEKDDRIPLYFNPLLLDLYNSTIAEMSPLVPTLTPEKIIGREMKVSFGQSSFLPDFSKVLGTKKSVTKTVVVAGVTPMVSPFGFYIPLSDARNLEQEVLSEVSKSPEYSRIFVEAERAEEVNRITALLQKKGFLSKSFREAGNRIRDMIVNFRIVVFALGFCIFVISLFSLVAMISVSVIEQHKTIGILRSLGASRKSIAYIFFLQSAFFVFFGTGIGLFLGKIIAVFFNARLHFGAESAFFGTGPLFLTSPLLAFSLFSVALFSALLFTFPPIFSATKKDPVEALWN